MLRITTNVLYQLIVLFFRFDKNQTFWNINLADTLTDMFDTIKIVGSIPSDAASLFVSCETIQIPSEDEKFRHKSFSMMAQLAIQNGGILHRYKYGQTEGDTYAVK